MNPSASPGSVPPHRSGVFTQYGINEFTTTIHGVEIDVHDYGSLDENNSAFSRACLDETPCACPEPCQHKCNWQGKGLIALSASMAAVTMFAAGCSMRCRHELELERLRLQMRVSSAESAVIEAQRRADEAFRALIAAVQSEVNTD